MFKDWKYQYTEKWVQHNPYQADKGIFQRTRTNNLKICMETQKNPNRQNNPEGDFV